MRVRQLLWIAVAPVVLACDAGLSGPPEAPFLGVRAEVYLNQALDVMEYNSIRRYEIDWAAFRAQARAEAEAAGSVEPADTYPAIVAALERIGDNHSFFRPAEAAPASAPGGPGPTSPARVDPSAMLVAPGVGYVDVPAFSGGGAEGDVLASSYHALIESVDTLGTSCRWVVDLRGNTGGNMWPMLAGIGPVLGEDTVGYFIDPDSVITSWIYEAGTAGVDSIVVATSDPVYELVSPRPHVAVLTDGETASSGEAIAVAFRGRPDTRSFGQATWGVSTANAAFPLPDGAVIFLTVATMVDRDGTVYGEELVPDEIVSGSKTGAPGSDAALAAALSWLEGRTCG
jgi:hypothetical protein